MKLTCDHLACMNQTFELFFAITAIVADTAVAVGIVAIAEATFAAEHTAVVPMSFLDTDGMSQQSSLFAILGTHRHLCSSTSSRPDAGPRFSFSSPSFFCGYQSRACSYIL